MKIAIPVEKDQGRESRVFGHFGSAPLFLIFDDNGPAFYPLRNSDVEHDPGHCQPLRALGGEQVDAVLVGGIGAGALMKLTQEGIRVFRAVEGSVAENLALFQAGKLPEFDPTMTCAGHGDLQGCRH